MANQFTKALSAINAANDKNKVDSTNEAKENTQVQEQTAAGAITKNIEKILGITQQASQAVNRATVDGLVGIPTKETGYDAYKKSFWGKNYTIFKAVIDEYKSRDKDYKGAENTEEKTETQTAAAQTGNTTTTPAATPATPAAAQDK